MGSNLGPRYAIGVSGSLTYQNKIVAGAWVVRFLTQDMPRDADYEVYHASIRGPGGYFLVFLDDLQYGVGENGRINEYAPASAAMYVRTGQEISFHWSISTNPAPRVWLYLRQPEVGRI